MKRFNSQLRYVEARPRKDKKGAKATTSVVVAGAASSEGGVSKSYVDSNFVTLSTEQTIPGAKDFTGGLMVNGQPIVWNAEKGVWQLTGDLVVTGAISMFSSLSGFVPSTVTDAVLVDNETIIKVKDAQGNWVLRAIGGGGSGGTGGGLTAAEVNVLISNALKPYALSSSIPTDNKQLTNGAGYITASALAGYATETWVTNKGYITSSALDGYATQSWVEGKKYLTGITSSQVTTALGYTPYNSSNPDKYIKGIDYDMVIAALGYTPYSTTNPMGYLTISSLLGYATEQWVGDNYLSKSGGVISFGNSNSLLTVKSTGGTWSGIKYESATEGGYIGVHQGEPVYIPQDMSRIINIIHSDNIKSTLGISDWALAATKPSYTAAEVGALSASGGTISGNLTISTNGWGNQLVLNGIDSNAGIKFQYSSSATATLYCAQNNPYWQIDKEVYNILHSGNYSDLLAGGTINGSITVNSSYKNLDYTSVANSALLVLGAIKNDGLFAGHDYNKGSWLQSSYYGTEANPSYQHAYNLLLNPLGGNVVIGGTMADAKLHVHGNGLFDNTLSDTAWVSDTGQLIIRSTSTNYHLGFGVASNGLAAIQGGNRGVGAISLLLNPNGGNVAVGGTTASAKFHVHGDILATGAITMFSQLSMKNVIDYDGLSLAQLAQIRPARFTWKDGRDSLVHVGGIADEVMQILPEVIYQTSDDKLTMDYGSAAFYIGTSLIKPVIDHEKRIAELEREVEYLREANRQLRAS
jgi:hypothetical protein